VSPEELKEKYERKKVKLYGKGPILNA
jgi:hypothetical protein